MTVVKRVVIECDRRTPTNGDPYQLKRCSATREGEVAEPRDVVLAAAHREGWTRDVGLDYCPEHSKEKA